MLLRSEENVNHQIDDLITLPYGWAWAGPDIKFAETGTGP